MIFNVFIIGELLKQVDFYIFEGFYFRIIIEGFEVVKEKVFQFLEEVKVSREMDREIFIDVVRIFFCIKVYVEFVDVLIEVVVDFILVIKK